ncbi:MAG: NosD domain-containing protein, partial [Euryarchaeota archaeon]|nr:NosD domain-containing protein [Euryarchaeota archaeon]
MKTIYTVCLIALLGLMIMVIPAAATTWDVYESDSIQAAIDGASDGDTVFVHAGTYSENIIINKPNIRLKGEGTDVVTLHGAEEGNIIFIYGEPSDASGCIVEGFNFNDTPLGCGVTVYSTAPNCIVRNNIFDGLYCAIETIASNTTFENNGVLNAQRDICAVYIMGSSCTIVNNTIKGSVGAAISLDGFEHTCENNIVTKNNLSSNVYAGIELYDAGSGNKIYLNNVVDNGVTATTTWSTAPDVTYWNSTEPIEYTYGGAIHTDYLGNYWGSDYTGSDGDGDGIGTPPYTVPDGLGEDPRPLMSGFENYPESQTPTPFLISGSV